MCTPHCWLFSVCCVQCHLGVILYINTRTPFCIATVVEHVHVSITSHSKDLNIVEYMMKHCHLMDMKQHISLAVCLINCYGAGRVRAVAVECTEMRALGICVWVVDRHVHGHYTCEYSSMQALRIQNCKWGLLCMCKCISSCLSSSVFSTVWYSRTEFPWPENCPLCEE